MEISRKKRIKNNGNAYKFKFQNIVRIYKTGKPPTQFVFIKKFKFHSIFQIRSGRLMLIADRLWLKTVVYIMI